MIDRLPRRTTVLLAAVAALCIGLTSQAASAEEPFVAEVIADSTPIYAGGGPTYYHVGKASRGQKVKRLTISTVTQSSGKVLETATAMGAKGRASQLTGLV